jgi:hypothetical protein
MPEGGASYIQEAQFSLQPVDFSMDDFEREAGLLLEPEPEESSLNRSRDSAKSIESLNTLLMRMPDISIPSPVHNPLPLQCLAANALPMELRREIDGLIAECSLFCEDQNQAHTQVAASSVNTSDSDATVTDVDGSRATGDAEEVDCASAEQVSAELHDSLQEPTGACMPEECMCYPDAFKYLIYLIHLHLHASNTGNNYLIVIFIVCVRR